MTGESSLALWLEELIKAVPEIRGIVEGNIEFYKEVMLHSILADLFPWIEEESSGGTVSPPLARFLIFFEEKFGLGDSYIDNAIEVSFIEDLGPNVVILGALGPKLSRLAEDYYPSSGG